MALAANIQLIFSENKYCFWWTSVIFSLANINEVHSDAPLHFYQREKRMKWKSSDIDPRLGPELDTSDHVSHVSRTAPAAPAPAPLAPAGLRHGECTLGLYGE